MPKLRGGRGRARRWLLCWTGSMCDDVVACCLLLAVLGSLFGQARSRQAQCYCSIAASQPNEACDGHDRMKLQTVRCQNFRYKTQLNPDRRLSNLLLTSIRPLCCLSRRKQKQPPSAPRYAYASHASIRIMAICINLRSSC